MAPLPEIFLIIEITVEELDDSVFVSNAVLINVVCVVCGQISSNE